MPEQFIELIKIKDNPYQGRKIYEDIEALGKSIAMYGLQEHPKARANGKGYQLKFGHRRREAFRWLAANWQTQSLPDRYNGYTVMPLDIEELTDEEMFQGAVIENEHRRNLNPIEQAEMMLVYRDQFKKTSEEIGELFGVSGATVRGIIRLRELPEPVKEKVAAGEISQGAARKLLTIARVDESQVKQAALNIVSGMSSEEALDEAMRQSDSAFVMWFGWKDGAPLAGEHLWRIDMQPDKFPMKHLPTLTVKDAIKALEADDADDAIITTIINVVNGASVVPVEQYMDSNPQYADWVERIKQLITPPACSACPFHSVSDKQHHCGFKPCHQRKKKAWLEAEALKVSKKLNILAYDPAKDGKTILVLDKHNPSHARLVKDGQVAIGVRVQPFINEYSQNAWTDSHLARLILTGEKVKELKEQKEKAADRAQSSRVDHEREWQLQRERADAADKFFEIASKPFAVIFKDLDHLPAMIALTRSNRPKKDAKKADVLAALRWEMAKDAIDNLNGYGWVLRQKGPVAVAKFLQGVAKEWGVKLPDDFIEMAKKFEPVAAETAKGKSK
jgi:ParB/RepB/Spo0J family partition protein